MSERSSTVPMIEARGLSKFYGNFAACRDITFDVSQGEIVAFLGPNGAGKSTTMKLLTGYLAPSEGVAKIAGHDMSRDRLAGSEAPVRAAAVHDPARETAPEGHRGAGAGADGLRVGDRPGGEDRAGSGPAHGQQMH